MAPIGSAQERNEMDQVLQSTLNTLIPNLNSSVSLFDGPLRPILATVQQTDADPPSQESLRLAREAVDLLHRLLDDLLVLCPTATGEEVEGMTPAIVTDYPWAELAAAEADVTVMDVGGGDGTLIASLLEEYPGLQGGLLDSPDIIKELRRRFHAPGGAFAHVADRVAAEHLVAGDVFHTVPPFTVYTMSRCLRQWPDEQALTVLRNIRKALVPGPQSRLVVIESVLADSHGTRRSRYSDLHLVTTATNQERTEAQWRHLAAAAGWEIVALYPLRDGAMHALDFRPVHEQYLMGHDTAEMNRLRAQHQWLQASMGRLIQAPVDGRRHGLRILDSGTADGHWLREIASDFPQATEFVGTDIGTHLFPNGLPGMFRFQRQDILAPWPVDWAASFDLVHQRLVLAACDSPSTAERAITALFALVRPGGWIQLLECDHSGGFTAEQEAQYPATTQFGQVVMAALAASGQYGQHGVYLERALLAAGAVDVVETLLDCPIGNQAAMQELRESTTANVLGVVRNLRAAQKKMALTGFPYSEQALDELHDALAEECRSKGSVQRFHLVYGRRPV